MPDRTNTAVEQTANDWRLFVIIIMLWLGVVARRLIGDEPLHVRKLFGELLLSLIFGVGLWALGLLQGLNGLQLITLGAFSALGGGRTVELVLRFVAQLKKG